MGTGQAIHAHRTDAGDLASKWESDGTSTDLGKVGMDWEARELSCGAQADGEGGVQAQHSDNVQPHSGSAGYAGGDHAQPEPDSEAHSA